MENSFRSSMFGFNKKDVTEFIVKLSRKNESVLKEKDDTIAELTKEISELKASFAEKDENYSKAVSKSNDNSEILSSVKSLEEKISMLLSSSRVKNNLSIEDAKSGDEAIEKINKISESVYQFADKAKKFDALSTMISGMVNNSEENKPIDYSEFNAEKVEISRSFESFAEEEKELLDGISQMVNSLFEEISKFDF